MHSLDSTQEVVSDVEGGRLGHDAWRSDEYEVKVWSPLIDQLIPPDLSIQASRYRADAGPEMEIQWSFAGAREGAIGL